jgi:hypothetical protein
LPILAAAAWVGCAAAGCAYGAEVRTLADYPPGVAAELRDVYGIVVPRWNTPLYGVVLAGVVVGIGIWAKMGLARQTPTTFWIMLALFSFGMFAIGYARADAVVMFAGVRGDQALDAAMLIAALSVWVSLLRAGRAVARPYKQERS